MNLIKKRFALVLLTVMTLGLSLPSQAEARHYVVRRAPVVYARPYAVRRAPVVVRAPYVGVGYGSVRVRTPGVGVFVGW